MSGFRRLPNHNRHRSKLPSALFASNTLIKEGRLLAFNPFDNFGIGTVDTSYRQRVNTMYLPHLIVIKPSGVSVDGKLVAGAQMFVSLQGALPLKVMKVVSRLLL